MVDLVWGTHSVGQPGHLDEDVALVLARVAEKGLPKISQLTVAAARQEFLTQVTKTNPPAPDGVDATDLCIAGPGGPLPLRIYRATPQPVGTLVYYHGGGFVLGGIASHDPICRSIAKQSGSTVVAVDYRLAPEHPYPAAVDDALAALDWAAAGPPELDDGTGPLGVAGDSAGGTLAAVAALAARDRGIRLALQILAYPAVDQTGGHASRQRLAEGYLLTGDDIAWFGRQYFGDTGNRLDEPAASPLRALSHAGLAPALVITAGFDPLADEGAAYAARLVAAGVAVRHLRLEGAIHGCLGLARWLVCGRRALDEIATAWKTACRSPA